MARPRFERLDPKRQQLILAAAAREFGAHGYAGASLNRVIRAAGLSKGVFYYYFEDKADLAATVFERAVRAVVGAFDRLGPPPGDVEFWKYFEAVARSSLASLRDGPGQDEVFALGAAAARDPRIAARLRPFLRDAGRIAAKFWRWGQEVGAVRSDLSPELLATLLQEVKGALARALLPADRPPTRRELDRFFDLQLDVFRRIAGPAERRAATRRRRGRSVMGASRSEDRE